MPDGRLPILQQVLQRSVAHLAAQLLAHRQQAQAQHRHCRGAAAVGTEQGRAMSRNLCRRKQMWRHWEAAGPPAGRASVIIRLPPKAPAAAKQGGSSSGNKGAPTVDEGVIRGWRSEAHPTGVASSTPCPPPPQCARRISQAAAAPAGRGARQGGGNECTRRALTHAFIPAASHTRRAGEAVQARPCRLTCHQSGPLCSPSAPSRDQRVKLLAGLGFCLRRLLCRTLDCGSGRLLSPIKQACLEHVPCASVGADVQDDLKEAGHLFVQRLGHLLQGGWVGGWGGRL